jgi:6-methylsalicylate decarboxylase
MAYLNSFHYDTAQAANAMALGSLLKFISPRQVLFGTDFPYRGTREQVDALKAMGIGSDVLPGIFGGNALRLLPRLAG